MNDNNRSSGYHTPNHEENNNWWKILLAVLAVLAILGVIIAFAMNDKKKEKAVTDPNPTTVTTLPTTVPTEPSTAPTPDVDELENKGTLGAHTVTIKSAKVVKDENGKDAIVVTYEIENGDNAVMNFLTVLSDTAYQGTTKLADAVLKDVEGFNGASISEDIQPKGKREVTRAFVLVDNTTPVKAIVKQIASTDNKVVVRTFDVK
ncbi:MAG: DUF5067 domain-containing protein [Oscillospiraceae bacterium]|jgi:hypothetical protein|nr:DUF5067 domain-containing protein [Oscillospiraceae bacterium]